MNTHYQPIGHTFIVLSKYYLVLLDEQLKKSPLEKYHYPFWYIAQNSGNLNQQQMAESLDIDKVAVVRMIDYFEKIGFVERKMNPADRRCHYLHITELGKSYVKPIEDALKAVDLLFFEEMKSKCTSWHNELIALSNKFKGISKDKITFEFKRIINED